MIRFRIEMIVFLAAGALSAAGTVRGDELAKLLKKPMSPASVALLAPYSREPAVAFRWRETLSDANPDVRAVAARAIDTCGQTLLLPDVENALAIETDREAAREEMRTLCLLGDARQRDLAIGAAERIGCALDADLVRSLARALGPEALVLYFQRLRALCLSDTDRYAFFLLASRGKAGTLAAAASMALGRRDDVAWRAVLDAAKDDPVLTTSPVLRTALASSDSTLRGEAAWYLASRYCAEPPGAPADILEALKSGEAADSQTKLDPELAFGTELLQRVLGKPAAEDKEWILCLKTNERCHLDSDIERSPLYKFLTEGEREAIEERNRKNLPFELNSAKKSEGPAVAVVGERSRLWAVDSLPRGLGEDLLRVASCGGVYRGAVGLADIAFGADGRPREVTLLHGTLGTGCEEILKAVFLLSLAPANQPTSPAEPLTLETVLLPEVLGCTTEQASSSTQMRSASSVYRVRGRIEKPKVSNRVEPVYPESARLKRVQGVTVLEAVISPEGCVKGLRVLETPAPILAESAVAAVSRWKYRPAMLDGRPVPVCLTVTVNFRLYR
jgi:TonB family protein